MRTIEAGIDAPGGPEAIRLHERDLPPPGPGEVLLRHEAIGLNFIDTYHRSGLYPTAMPAVLGMEAAGVIEAVGAGVTGFAPGDRVATLGPELGAYATRRLIAADRVLPLPDEIDGRTAAAALLKGCTAEFLAERVTPVAAGDWVLVHAAAGGVGQLLVQWLAAKGARVIGTAGNAAKQAIAREAGCETVLAADAPDLADRVRDATGGKGVRVAYDGVGAATWPVSLAACGPRGMVVSFGNASGPVTGIALGALAAHGSLYATRPTLFDYYRDPAERAAGVARLWQMLRSRKLQVSIGQTFALAHAAEAHRALEYRATTGSTLLIP